MRKADVSDTGLAQATPGGIWRISPPAAGCAKGNTRYGRGRAPLRPQQLARTGDSARVMILKPDVRAKIDFKRLLQHLPRHPLRGTHRARAIGACGEIDHELAQPMSTRERGQVRDVDQFGHVAGCFPEVASPTSPDRSAANAP